MREAVYDEIYDLVSCELKKVGEAILWVAKQEGKNSEKVALRLRHIVALPGKKLRPIITLLTSRLAGRCPDERSISMATAIELLHIATLVHDDTVDRADIRRGSATARTLWSDNVAVLLGDYLFASSAMFVCDTNSMRLVRRFAETITELSRGELREIFSAWNIDHKRKEYMTLIYDKTASLFVTAAESGGVLGGSSEKDISAISEYGRSLGLAYQIFDDVLDYEASESDIGKPSGRDLMSGLMTLPAILAVREDGARNAIHNLFEAPSENKEALLSPALEAVRSSGAIEEAGEMADKLIDAAVDSLNSISSYIFATPLENVAAFCRGRTS